MDNNNGEKIDAYIHNRMTDDERQKFEIVIKKDKEVREEVDMLLSYKESYAKRDILDLRNRLDGFSSYSSSAMDSENDELKVDNVRQMPWLRIAVGIAAAMLIGVAFFVFIPNEDEKLAESFEKNLPFTRMRTMASLDDENPVEKLQVLILNQEYEKYLQFTDSLLIKRPNLFKENGEELNHGRAYSMIGLGEFEKAKLLLQEQTDCYSLWLKWYVEKKNDSESYLNLLQKLKDTQCQEYYIEALEFE